MAIHDPIRIRPPFRRLHEVSGVKQETALWLDSLAAEAPARLGCSSRPSYVVANEDWPAVATIQPDEEAYEALLGVYLQMDDATYDRAMAELKNTEIPADTE